MPHQPPLDGLYAGLEAEVRPLFFAVRPDATAAPLIVKHIGATEKLHGLSGKWLRPDLFHITLQPVDVFAAPWEQVIERAMAIGDAIHWPAVKVRMDHAMTFARRSNAAPFVLAAHDCAPAVQAFQRELWLRLKTAGLGRFSKPDNTPHLTLGYHGERIGRYDIEPIEWVADELLLIKSLYGESEHVVVGRWPLQRTE